MKKALFFLIAASLILDACSSKSKVAVGSLEFQYPSIFTIASHDVVDSLGMETLRFVDEKDSLGVLYLQVIKEKIDSCDSTCSCPVKEYLSLAAKKTEGLKKEKAFKLDDAGEKRLMQLARPIGKYLADKAFAVFSEQFVPKDTTLNYGIEEPSDLRIIIDDPMVVEVGAFVAEKQTKDKLSSAIRATLFNGYTIIAYSQSSSDARVDGFMGIYTSVRALPEENDLK